AFEPELEPLCEPGSPGEVQRELLLRGAPADARVRVSGAALHLQGADRHGAGTRRDAGPVGLDAFGLRRRARCPDGEGSAEGDEALRRRPQRSAARVSLPELLPELRLLPAGLAEALPLLVEVRIRKQDRNHLLAAAVPEPEPPRRRRARAALGLE